MFKHHKQPKQSIIPQLTIDCIHRDQMKLFQDIDDKQLPSIRLHRDTLVEKCSKKNATLDDKLELTDKIKELDCKILKLSNQKINYMLNNSGNIFTYFKNKKSIYECNNKTTVVDGFFGSAVTDTPTPTKIFDCQITTYERDCDLEKFIINTDKCSNCMVGEMIAIDYDGVLICNRCSSLQKHLVENDKPSFKEPPKEVCFYAYKRINHFREILAQFQAKETTQIPDSVIENIVKQLKKERIDVNNMSNKTVKDVLKKLGYNKFYEHIPFIKDKLGIRPPIMCAELETLLCNLFSDIQAPYTKYCPDDRTNFLNYHYTIYKLCELLDQRKFLPFFPMLKDPEKRIEQDEIWKKICDELNWEFIPTI